MTKLRFSLSDLTDGQLDKRIDATYRRAYDMEEELARRARIEKYGTETPELQPFPVDLSYNFLLTACAKDAQDAANIVDETKWLWWRIAPGGSVEVDDHEMLPAEVDDEADSDVAEDRTKQLVFGNA